MLPNKKDRLVVIYHGNTHDAYSIKSEVTDTEIRAYRKFKGYPIEFIRKQVTNLYEFYYFRIRKGD
jgi:hypothetical protein